MSSMTMAGSRMNGKLSKNKILGRFINLLNIVYLEAQPLEGGGYRISDKVFESIQTELDFTPPKEKDDQEVEKQIKKRYRQRSSYRFWKECLDLANIGNYDDAKEFLLNIHGKLDRSRHYGTLTHSRYALETLELALDDTYGTGHLILTQYMGHLPKKRSPKKKSKKTKTNKAPQSNLTPF